MGDASIRGAIGMPIRDVIVEIGVIVEIEVTAAIGARDATVGTAWRDAAAEVETVTVVASADVTRIDASALQSVATMRFVRKAKAIATKVGAAKVVAVKEAAIAGIPTGRMEIARKRATGPVARSTGTTTSEIASTRR